MRTVYRKIFVTCGLGGLVMLAIGVAFSFLIVGERISDFAGQRTARIASDAARELENSGVAGLERWVRAQEGGPDGNRVYIIDDRGVDLLHREVPSQLAERTRSMFGRAPEDRPGVYSAPRWVPQLQTPDGRRHAVIVIRENPDLLERVDLAQLPFVLLALAAAISALVAYALARWLSAPVRALANATHALARGEVDARVDSRVVARADELGALGRDFNAMAARLGHLLTTREQLIRDLSHELRTPLARLNVALELLRRKDPEQRLATDHARIQEQVDRLDQMIEAILSFARLGALAQPPAFTLLDVRDVTQEVVADSQLEAEQRDCVIEYRDLVHAPALARASAALLRSAIQNVVRNALRHTAQGSKIEVSVESVASTLRIRVRDHGPGVPDGHIERIFEPFYRVDDSRGRDPSGTGLGLAIVARVMAAHRGSVHARNVPTGGFEMTLRLPVAEPGVWEPDLEALTVPVPDRPPFEGGASRG